MRPDHASVTAIAPTRISSVVAGFRKRSTFHTGSNHIGATISPHDSAKLRNNEKDGVNRSM
jgi:hypothetical protein